MDSSSSLKSDYFKNLASVGVDVVERYAKKIEIINSVDPYTLDDNDLSVSIDRFPPVTSMDIVAYLVLTHSFYTQEQMKAYKSLLGYKYFEAGFVQKVGAIKISTYNVIIGTVSLVDLSI